MYASLSTTTVTLADGSVCTIRKLSGLEWKDIARAMRDRGVAASAHDHGAEDKAIDEADRLTLVRGLVAVPDGRPIDDALIADLDPAAFNELTEAIIRHTKPELFAASPIEAAKNDSGPSMPISTETGQSQPSAP